MYIPEETVEEIRQKNDIVDVISGYVNLKRRGNNYFGLCPFHNEKTGSFSVSVNKQMYYCFGCGAGGSVITFIMNYENYTYVEALKYLAQKAGVTLPEIEETAESRARDSRRQKLLNINKESANYFYYQLRQPHGKIGYDYLKDRMLSEETMKKFALGFSNKTSNDLVQYLRHKGYSDDLIKDSGVAVFHEKYGLNDKFWNRVMFPIQDSNHRVIGFGGRVMGEGEPKYLNSPETEVFDKSRNLYGLNHARSARKNNIILCEGYMDVIAMHQAGFNQAVASLGTAFTSGQANLLRRFTDKVILSYDSDGAGTKAALRAIGILREAGLSGRVLNLKPYKDPDEFIKNLGAEQFNKRLEEAENSFFFEIRMLEGDFDLGDPEGKTKFYNAIADKLCRFEEQMERDNYLEAITGRYNIDPGAMQRMVVEKARKLDMGTEKTYVRPMQTKNTKPKDASGTVQKLLLTWISDQPEIYQVVKPYITVDDFTEELYKEVASYFFADLEQGICNPAAILSKFTDEEKQREVAEIFNTKLQFLEQDGQEQDAKSVQTAREKALHDIVVKVKEHAYEVDIANSGKDMSAITRAIDAKRKLEELQRKQLSLG